MNCFVLHHCIRLYYSQRSAKTKEKNLQSFLDVAKTKYVESSYEVEGPNYWLVMTLLLWSKENWNQNKIKMLERLLILTQVNDILYYNTMLYYNKCRVKNLEIDYNINISNLLMFFASFAGKLSKI